MYHYFGILFLTVLSFNHVRSECYKEKSERIISDLKRDLSEVRKPVEYVYLYQRMAENYEVFGMNLFDCDDDAKLVDAWTKLKTKLMRYLKKSCPDFESSFGEIEQCRVNLDVYNFEKDQAKYCSTFEQCSGLKTKICAPLRELILLENRQSNASVNFCNIECDDISALRKILSNCWASVQVSGQSTQMFELFSDCVIPATKPTCRITKTMISRIFPLFNDQAHQFHSATVSEKPESECMQEWNSLEKIEILNPSMCKILEDMKPCITKSLKGNIKRYNEKLAKCQYSMVNLIRTEALQQATDSTGGVTATSTAAGMLGSGRYHLAVMCWLVTMVTYYSKFQ